MVTVKIKTSPFVAEYIRGKFWDDNAGVVKIPPTLDLYVYIYDLLQKRPQTNPVDKGNLEFALPDCREGRELGGKRPELYNYISDAAGALIARKMAVMMWAELHDFMDENKHLRGVQFRESVICFMAKYGIVSITEEALLKNYQRWRDKVRKRVHRINIKKKFRK